MTTASRAGLHAAALVLAAVLLALTAGWAAPAPAYACSCAASTDAQLAAQADVIFTGTVADDQADESTQTRTLTFTVNRAYKGRVTSTQVVTTASSGSSCGLDVSGPGPYLVFADEQQSGRTADLCGGTRARPAPASLGPGQAPLADPLPSADPDAADPMKGRWVPLVGVILAASAVTVFGLSLTRQRPE